MLCSMAYFFALVTSSCCSEVRRGRAPPSIPSSADRVPGPNATSPVWRMSYTGCNRYGGIFVSVKGWLGCEKNTELVSFLMATGNK
uniref:Putative secreted peptide n=1 Tax=Anopheles braziliensis TaxID=58242 RepID=A0A2M3ZQ15_9DIPT